MATSYPKSSPARATVFLSLVLCACVPETAIVFDDRDQPDASDCDDADAVEVCDGVDNNCDGIIDGGTACAMIDTFEPQTQLDLLFVVDNSLSMGAEQVWLRAGAAKLIPWFYGDWPYHDTHIGVITTDMDDPAQAGRLQSGDEARFANADMMAQPAQAVAWLTSALDVGITGSSEECAREAVDAALNEHNDTVNAGFRRDEAHLMIVVVSDEDDASVNPTIPTFVAMLEELDTGPGSTFHAIVAPETDCPDDTYGAAHLKVVDQTGGTTHPICRPDYAGSLEPLAQLALDGGTRSRFKLSATPDGSYMSVLVTDAFGDSEYYGPHMYDWIQDADVVSLHNPPQSGSTVEISYKRLP